jgi:hypothetical protein
VQIDDAAERSKQEETKRLLFPLPWVASGESKGVAHTPKFYGSFHPIDARDAASLRDDATERRSERT